VKAFSGVRVVCWPSLRFTPGFGDVTAVSSRRGTSKDRSLENSGCARASVLSAEVVTGASWLRGAWGITLRAIRGLSAETADGN